MLFIYARKKQLNVELREVWKLLLGILFSSKKKILFVYDLLNSPPTFGDYFSVLFVARFLNRFGKNIKFIIVHGDYTGSYNTSWGRITADKKKDLLGTFVHTADIFLDSDTSEIELIDSGDLEEKLKCELASGAEIFCKEKIIARQRIYPYCFNVINKLSFFLTQKTIAKCLLSKEDYLGKCEFDIPDESYITFHCRYSQQWGFDRNVRPDEFVKIYKYLRQNYSDKAIMIVSDNIGCNYIRRLARKHELPCLYSEDYSTSIVGDGGLILSSDYYFAIRGGGISVFPILSLLPYKIIAPYFGHWIPCNSNNLSYWSANKQNWAISVNDI